MSVMLLLRAAEPAATTRPPDPAPLPEELATLLRENAALRTENAALRVEKGAPHERIRELEARPRLEFLVAAGEAVPWSTASPSLLPRSQGD
jgi:hypothetical protein